MGKSLGVARRSAAGYGIRDRAVEARRTSAIRGGEANTLAAWDCLNVGHRLGEFFYVVGPASTL